MRSKVLVWPPPEYGVYGPLDADTEEQQKAAGNYIVVEDKAKLEEIQAEVEASKEPDDPSPPSVEEVMSAESNLRKEELEMQRRRRAFSADQARAEREKQFKKIVEEQKARVKQKTKDLQRLERDHTHTLAAAYGMYGANTNVDKINDDFAVAKDKLSPRADVFGMTMSVGIDNALMGRSDDEKVIMDDGNIVVMNKELAEALRDESHVFDREDDRMRQLAEDASEGLEYSMGADAEVSQSADAAQQEIEDGQAVADEANQEALRQQEEEAQREEQLRLEEEERRRIEEENERIREQLAAEQEAMMEAEYAVQRAHDERVVKDLMTSAAAVAVVGQTAEGLGTALGSEAVAEAGVNLVSKNRSEFQLALDDLQETYNQEATDYYRTVQAEETERLQMGRIYGIEGKSTSPRALPAVAVNYPYILEESTYNGKPLPYYDVEFTQERQMSL